MWWGARNGRPPHERPNRLPARHRGDDRGGQGCLVVEVRQQPGDRPRQQGLAGARRPDQQHRVPAGEGDLERTPRDGLAPHVREVHDRGAGRAPRSPWTAGTIRPRWSRPGHPPGAAAPGRGRRGPRRPHGLRCLRDARDGDGRRARGEPRLIDGLRRHEDPVHTALRPSAMPIGSTPGTRAHLAAQPQLPDQRHASRPRPQLLRAQQDPERDREVQRRPGLAQLRRGEVDRDPARRMVVAGVAQRARGRAPAPRTAPRPAGRRS